MFRKILDTGEAGDNIGALLRGVERTDVERGQVLSKPGSVTPHTKFEAQAYVLKKKKVEDIHLSLQNIDLSFILEQQMLLVKLNYHLAQKWLCQVMMLNLQLN